MKLFVILSVVLSLVPFVSVAADVWLNQVHATSTGGDLSAAIVLLAGHPDLSGTSSIEATVTIHGSRETTPSEESEESEESEVSEESLATDSPEESLTTDSPEESLTTDSPEESLTTESPEESLTTESPEESPPSRLITVELIGRSLGSVWDGHFVGQVSLATADRILLSQTSGGVEVTYGTESTVYCWGTLINGERPTHVGNDVEGGTVCTKYLGQLNSFIGDVDVHTVTGLVDPRPTGEEPNEMHGSWVFHHSSDANVFSDYPNDIDGRKQTITTEGPEDSPTTTEGPEDSPTTTEGPEDSPTTTEGPNDSAAMGAVRITSMGVSGAGLTALVLAFAA